MQVLEYTKFLLSVLRIKVVVFFDSCSLLPSFRLEEHLEVMPSHPCLFCFYSPSLKTILILLKVYLDNRV